MKIYKGLNIPSYNSSESYRQKSKCRERLNSDKDTECADLVCKYCIFDNDNLKQYIEWEKENVGDEDERYR